MLSSAQVAAERRMISSYALRSAREGLTALFALDDTLASILRTTRDPMVGQMRLTWWHGALTALDTAPAPAEPVLQALAWHVVPHTTGEALADIVAGWEELLDPDLLNDRRLMGFAEGRGGGVFVAAGTVLGAQPSDPLAQAGRGWALADLAAHTRDAPTGMRAAALAADDLAVATARIWSRRARALGAMAHLARMAPDAGAARVGRAVWHRLTGR